MKDILIGALILLIIGFGCLGITYLVYIAIIIYNINIFLVFAALIIGLILLSIVITGIEEYIIKGGPFKGN